MSHSTRVRLEANQIWHVEFGACFREIAKKKTTDFLVSNDIRLEQLAEHLGFRSRSGVSQFLRTGNINAAKMFLLLNLLARYNEEIDFTVVARNATRNTMQILRSQIVGKEQIEVLTDQEFELVRRYCGSGEYAKESDDRIDKLQKQFGGQFGPQRVKQIIIDWKDSFLLCIDSIPLDTIDPLL